MNFKSLLVIALSVFASAGAAENLSGERAMASALEQAGTHEFKKRRHELRVENCIMTTFVYEDWDEHEKVLWSSFRFDVRFAKLMPAQDGRRFFWSASGPDTFFALTLISMVEGTFARHEMAMRRNPKPPFEPSPRTGLDSYVYKDKSDFYIIHDGYTEPTQPDAFVTLFEQYKSEHCTTVG